MNEIVNNFLLARDKFMPEMHLRQPGFTYSACGPFTKKQKGIKNVKETGESRYIYEIREKKLNIVKDPIYDGYQLALASVVYNFLILIILKMNLNIISGIKNENVSNKKLAEELHKLIIRKFNKIKVHSPFIDNIWDADLADMQLRSKFNKVFGFLLCVIDIYSKYAWVSPLKDEKAITITIFQKILGESNRKPNNVCVDKGSAFYNRSMKKSWLEKNGIEMYSTLGERKSVIAERIIRTLKIKIYKYMASVSKTDLLDYIVNDILMIY